MIERPRSGLHAHLRPRHRQWIAGRAADRWREIRHPFPASLGPGKWSRVSPVRPIELAGTFGSKGSRGVLEEVQTAVLVCHRRCRSAKISIPGSVGANQRGFIRSTTPCACWARQRWPTFWAVGDVTEDDARPTALPQGSCGGGEHPGHEPLIAIYRFHSPPPPSPIRRSARFGPQ